ncbi:cystatin-A-like [Chiroxiphia lanceolata]|uniref:cystatin-A-like n=1 Tax=Chiroxiphia lanceolata TaxID=296741 RepID=UPI0013CEF123|nr:cystatin-A-like [Chiroxiphia lanceolata]
MSISLMNYVLPHMTMLLSSPLLSRHTKKEEEETIGLYIRRVETSLKYREDPKRPQGQSTDYSPLSHPKQERLREPPVMLKQSPIAGGLSPPDLPTQEVQDITNQVKLQFRVRVNGSYDIFRAILYRTQVVAGTMYFIKVQVNGVEYVHLKVFVGLPAENVYPVLVNFQTGKTRNDPLDYF